MTEDVNLQDVLDASGTVVGHDVETSGTLGFRDVDLIDTHTALAVFTSSTSSAALPGFVDGTTNIGTFIIDPSVTENNGDTVNTGSLNWHFTLDDSDPVLQSLAVGETITQVYTVTVTDNHGSSVPQDVTITITGTNDAPTIVAGSTVATGGVTEDVNLQDVQDASGTVVGHDVETSGTLGFRDVDLIDTHTALAVFTSSTSSAALPGFVDGTTNIGTFTIDPSVTENNGDTVNTGSLGWHFTLDDSNPVLQSLADGQTITQVYTVTVTDNNGAPVSQDVTITLHGTNDIPVAVADTNSGDAVVEAGVGPGNTPFAGADDTASGNVLSNDTDVDAIDTKTVVGVEAGTASGPLSAGVGATITGTYGTLTLAANGTWTYTLDNNNPDTQALAQDQHASDVFTYTMEDSQHAPSTTTLMIDVTGTNDVPVVSGDTSGSVAEEGAHSASGQLTVSDDQGDTQTWTIQGGTRVAPPSYQFAIDRFTVTKGATVIVDDPFTSVLPPNTTVDNVTNHFSPGATNIYTSGSTGFGSSPITLNGGEFAALYGANASFSDVNGNGDYVFGQFATLATNKDPNEPTLGLKDNTTFAVNGLFDLALPTDGNETYGIRLTDRDGAQPGTQAVELAVVNIGGSIEVKLREIDFATGTSQSLGSPIVVNPDGHNEIQLTLTHDATNDHEVVGSFQLADNGVLAAGTEQTFGTHGEIFYDENWTRAQFFGKAATSDPSASPTADLVLNGTYGTLDITQSGAWTYALNDTLPATQALSAGETEPDSFTVNVVDNHGAVTPQVIDISVTGINDAPVLDLNGPSNSGINRTFTYTEGDGNVKIAALATVADVDSADFDGGSLKVEITANGDPSQDHLSIKDGGTDGVDPNPITLVGNSVEYNGTSIGTVSGSGNFGDPLTVDFNSDATPAAVEALAEHIRYLNSSDDPSTAPRTVTFTLVDGDSTANGGSDTATAHATIDVVAVNDAPVISADNIQQTPREVAQNLFGGAGDQNATGITYANGVLYIVGNDPQAGSNPSAHAFVDEFSTTPGSAPVWTQSWNHGNFFAVAADATQVYAAGAISAGDTSILPQDYDNEDKTLLVRFAADGTAGNNPSPALGFTTHTWNGLSGTTSFFGYQGVDTNSTSE